LFKIKKLKKTERLFLDTGKTFNQAAMCYFVRALLARRARKRFALSAARAFQRTPITRGNYDKTSRRDFGKGSWRGVTAKNAKPI
jgi:hypothetical protein